jgi:hypothetical protein
MVSIPAICGGIQQQQREALTWQKKAAKTAKIADFMTAAILGLSIFFPVALPLFLISDGISAEARSAGAGTHLPALLSMLYVCPAQSFRHTECVLVRGSLSDAIETCNRLSDDVSSACETIHAISEWWADDVRRLEKLEKDANPKALKDVEPILIEGLQDQWEEVAEKYKWYSGSVSPPSSLPLPSRSLITLCAQVRALGDFYTVTRRVAARS